MYYQPMKYFWLVFVLIICSVSFVSAETIKAGISYTVNEARQLAFDDVDKKIDISKYKDHFFDKNYAENIKAIQKNKFKQKGRRLVKFLNRGVFSYAVTYTKDENTSFYYNENGELEYIDIEIILEYPRKTATYNTKGELDNITINVSHDNQFVFDINKKLLAHWIGKYGYDEKGEFIGTRE